MDNNFDSVNHIIRGSYSSILNSNYFDFSNSFYLTDLNQLLECHIEEEKYLKKQIYELEFINIKLLKNIIFLDKRCNFVNITHSNTINFILQNYRQLKHVLDNLVIMYNNNLNHINSTKEKIFDINLYINKLKSNINYYKHNY
jgi:hypothetical protein